MKKSTKGYIIAGVVVLCAISFIGGINVYRNGLPSKWKGVDTTPVEEKKEIYDNNNEYKHTVDTKDDKVEVKSMEQVKEKQEEKDLSELEQLVRELKNLPIENIECVNNGYGYTDVNITIRNKGDKSVNYVKINLYYYDENNNIIQSEWTNDNSTILPNATQTITKMTNVQFNTVKAEIDEIVH